MKENRIDQALSALGFALKEIQQQSIVNNPLELIQNIPDRSLTGNHILGGKILNFSSSGITDNATTEQISIKEEKVTIKNLKVGSLIGDLSSAGTIKSKEIHAEIITADTLNVKEIKADIQFEKNSPIKFNAEAGKGLLWIGKDYTKQFVFNSNPDRFFSSESIDIAKGQSIYINGTPVLKENELGSSIVKSNIKELGRLKGLIVDGSVLIDNYIYYDNRTNRFGIGTDEPNGALSIAEDGIEIIAGTKNSSTSYIGNFASHTLELVTDNTARLTITAGGNIDLGNSKNLPVQVSVYGKLAIKVANPDPEVDLHVNGAIKYNGRTQRYDKSFPTAGSHNSGDIVWNSEPRLGSFVGWICIKAGNPGTWQSFGKIGVN